MTPASRANDRIVIRLVKRRLRAREMVVGEGSEGVRTRMSKKEWGWTRISANGRKVSTSGEGYGDRGYCIRIATDLNPGIPVRGA